MAKLKIAPLSSGFMLTSMLGGLVSLFYIYPRNNSWGAAFTFLFVVMFIAAMISMTYAPVHFSHERKMNMKK